MIHLVWGRLGGAQEGIAPQVPGVSGWVPRIPSSAFPDKEPQAHTLP